MLRSETAAEPARLQAALAGLRRYQEAERAPSPAPMPVLAERHGAALRDYGGDGPITLFIPSLINPPGVLDMGERSLLRWLAGRGRRVLLLDWGWPGADRHAMTVAGHVERIALPLLEGLGAPVDLVGYCLGGTMAYAVAQLGPVRSLATIAAPWHFKGFPAGSRAQLEALWAGARPTVDALGVLPMARRRAPSSPSRTGPMTGRPSPAPPPARCSKACSATTCPAADSGGWTQP